MCNFRCKRKLIYIIHYLITIILILITIILHFLSTEFGRTHVFEKLSDCYFTENGEDYIGHRSYTRNGLTCQEWIKQSPQKHHYSNSTFAFFRDGSPIKAKNYCRNPIAKLVGPRSKPWCYTTKADRRWEYCFEHDGLCNLRALFIHGAETELFDKKVTLFYPTHTIVIVIWVMTYIWIFFSFLFLLAFAMLRKINDWNALGLKHPDVLIWYMNAAMWLSLMLHISWMFLWDREYIEVSFVLWILSTFFSSYVSFGNNWNYQKFAIEIECIEERTKVRRFAHFLLLQNGLVAFFTTTTFFNASMFTIVMETNKVLNEEVAALFAISILFVMYIAWCIFDLILMSNSMSYLYSPQIVCIIFSAGTLSRSWNSKSTAMILLAVFVVIVVATLETKIIVTIVLSLKKKKAKSNVESLPSSSTIGTMTRSEYSLYNERFRRPLLL